MYAWRVHTFDLSPRVACLCSIIQHGKHASGGDGGSARMDSSGTDGSARWTKLTTPSIQPLRRAPRHDAECRRQHWQVWVDVAPTAAGWPSPSSVISRPTDFINRYEDSLPVLLTVFLRTGLTVSQKYKTHIGYTLDRRKNVPFQDLVTCRPASVPFTYKNNRTLMDFFFL